MHSIIHFILFLYFAGALLVQPALSGIYRHTDTGIVFPDRIGELEREETVTDYEPVYPGLGISVGYNRPGIYVTIYIYTLGLKTVPPELDSPVLREHMRQAGDEIVTAGELGYYHDVRRVSSGQLDWDTQQDGISSLHACYTFRRSGRDRVSHLYLLALNDHFIKVRSTYDSEQAEKMEKIQREFLSGLSAVLKAACRGDAAAE